jgi:hypothetical protein
MEEFKQLVTAVPVWAQGLPVAAKVRNGARFAKLASEQQPQDDPIEEMCGEVPKSKASEPEPQAQPKSQPKPQPEHKLDSEPPPEDEKPTRGNGQAGDGYPHGEHDFGRKAAEYIYRDLKGAPYLKIVKRVSKSGKKFFPQYHLENNQWVKGKPAGPPIPYRLPELLAAAPGVPLWICEGEKDAENLARLGLIATTNPGGAGKWTPGLNKWLASFQVVYILEDNDAAGRDHVSKVAAALHDIIPDIRVLTFRELPEHGDVSDWLEAGGTLEKLLERAKQAPKFAALEYVCAADEEIEDLDWI